MKNIFVIIPFVLMTGCLSKPKSDLSTLYIGQVKIYVEVAKNQKQKQKGLMNRKYLDKNNGMLFIFKDESKLSFWMKNTLIPLSIAFINKNCEIVDMQEMYPLKEGAKPIYYTSQKPSRYALEANLNWFKKNNIEVGQTIATSKSSTSCKLELL